MRSLILLKYPAFASRHPYLSSSSFASACAFFCSSSSVSACTFATYAFSVSVGSMMYSLNARLWAGASLLL